MEDGEITMASSEPLKKKWIKLGLPTIAAKVSVFNKKQK